MEKEYNLEDIMNMKIDDIINLPGATRKSKNDILFVDIRTGTKKIKITYIGNEKYLSIPKDKALRDKMIRDLHNDGFMQVEIARIMNISQTTVSKKLK